MQTETLQKFPCEFVIKTFGLSSPEYETAVLMIMRKHIPNLPEDFIRSRLSKDGKYLALTLTVPIDNKEQLDSIYQELSQSTHVLMAL